MLRKQNANSERLNLIIANWCKTAQVKRLPAFTQKMMEDFQSKWDVYDELHHEILILATPGDKEKHEYFVNKVFENSYRLYCELMGEMNTVLMPAAVAPANANPVSDTCISLPRLNIPKFSGRYEDWRSFFDLFSASVHSKNTISAVHKLQMLKSLLDGEAEALLRHFQITEVNYEAAWKCLVDRYDNKRVLVNTQLRKLLSQTVASEDSNGIKRLLDNTMECIHALEGLEIDIENWDAILNYIVTQRLPVNTHALWEQMQTSSEIPTFDSLTKFLEKRFRALEFQSVETNPVSASPKKNKAQVNHVSSNQCWMCKQSPHQLKFCPIFLKSSPKQRSDVVMKRKLCRRCFAYSHKSNDCPSKICCSKCNRDHNSLLHFENNNQTQSGIYAKVASTHAAVADADAPPQSALVHTKSNKGSTVVLRALLDNGSQVNLITEDAVKLLGLRKCHSQITVCGVGNIEATHARSKVSIIIHSRINPSAAVEIDALIMPTLTQTLPTRAIEFPPNLLQHFELAD